MARDKIDLLEARWLAVASPAMSRDLLPDHPWLGDPDLRESGLVITGATWVVCADLMVEPVDRLPFRRRPIVDLRGLASMARRLALPVAASDIASYDGFTAQLEVIEAGTELRLVDVSGWVDCHFLSVGRFIRFAVPEGWAFLVNTHEAREVDCTASGQEVWEEGIEWWRLACAAVIVPATHSFAMDTARVGDALARIDAAASAAHSAHLSMAASPARA